MLLSSSEVVNKGLFYRADQEKRLCEDRRIAILRKKLFSINYIQFYGNKHKYSGLFLNKSIKEDINLKIAVVGCTHAGTMAVLQILKDHPDTRVTVYERDSNISFLSCGIHLYLGGKVRRLEDMFYASPQELEKQGAKVKIRHEVLKIDAQSKTLKVADMTSGHIFTDYYDKLIMTTGSSVRVPPLFGIDHAKVLLCKNFEQAREIYNTAKENKKIAIVGGGYVGVELAESYVNTGHEVVLFQAGKQILNNYVGAEFAHKIKALLSNHHINVMLNHRVTAFTENENGNLIIQSNHKKFVADMAIVATGFVPNTQLLKGQVNMDKNGAIIINNYVQTSNPDIYAAGDACVTNYNPTGEAAYLPLASSAVRQGILAGINVFGNCYPYIGTQATTGMQLFGYTLATTGLTYEIALRKELNAKKVYLENTIGFNYKEPVSIELVYDQDTRKILGAQLWSKHEVAQSANALSIAIQNGNTIDDLASLNSDFKFLNIVAQMAINQIH
ncbi:NADH oxidase [Lactiplantibacillus plantarum]|uniref:NADH peroxidase n=2 Tax=Lactiplantibacillus plantarum TaxID=1590 RepID=A0A1E3KT81_LACPN|nr:FAD-dependent oxidoreductase [Lactiplantibacillus plantarum]ODO61266.1 NADH peroxidase [Lactiplantibacillus plantarum]